MCIPTLHATLLAMTLAVVGCRVAPKSPDKSRRDWSAPSAGARGVDAMHTKRRLPDSREVDGAATRHTPDCARPGVRLAAYAFTVVVSAPAEIGLGKSGQAVVTVTPKGGYQMDLHYDHELSFNRIPSGVKLGRRTYESKHASRLDKGGLKFVIKFTGSVAGEKIVQGVLDFSVYTSSRSVARDDLCVSWETTFK